MARAGDIRTLPVRSRRATPSAISVLLFAAILVSFALDIFLVTPAVAGIPIRFIFSAALFLVLAGAYSRLLLRAVSGARWALLIILYLGVAGSLIAVFRDGASVIPAELVGNHIQGILIMLMVAMATIQLGGRSITYALAVVIGISCVFSLLQWAGIQPAFDVRSVLSGANGSNELDSAATIDRAPGLSFSTIYLVQQCCLLFAAGLFVSSQRGTYVRRRSPIGGSWLAIFGWGSLIVLVSFTGGNRSPILGLIIFGAILLSVRDRRMLFITIPIIIGAYFLIDPARELLASAGYRLGETGDKSSSARAPLITYGLRLLAANPLGYGLGFDSKALVGLVQTSDLKIILNRQHMVMLLEEKDLHNYWLTMANIYGVFVIPAAIYVARYLFTEFRVVLLFVPYLVHITFHNAGPLANDYMVWVPLGIILGMRVTKPKERPQPLRRPGQFGVAQMPTTPSAGRG